MNWQFNLSDSYHIKDNLNEPYFQDNFQIRVISRVK